MSDIDYWAHAHQSPLENWPTDANGQPEQAAKLAIQWELDSRADITLSMLHSYGIPAFKEGSLGKVIFGFAQRGVDIYVPASRLREAQELMAVESADDSESE
jgi:hypothetical protein